MPADPDLPAVFTRAEAIGAGLSRHQIAQRVRSGRWRTLRRGVYAVHERYAALPAREQHLLSVIAVLITRGEGVLTTVLDHHAPVTGPPPERSRARPDPFAQVRDWTRVKRAWPAD